MENESKKYIEEIEAYEKRIPYAHDKIFKKIFEKDPEATLKVLGFNFGFKEFMRNEWTNDIYAKTMNDVCIISLDGKGRIFEIQKGDTNLDDILRFLEYQTIMERKLKRDVFIYIISIDKVLDDPITYKNEQGSKFTINTKSLILFDSNKALNRINDKIELNKDFNRENIVEFKLLHYMDKEEEQKELVKKLIMLTPKIKNLAKEDLNEIKIIQITLAQRLFKDKEELNEILGEIKMEFDMEKFGIAAYIGAIKKIAKLEGEEIGEEKGIKIGEEKGKEKMKYEIANELIKEGVPPEKISKATKLNIETIKSIYEKNKS